MAVCIEMLCYISAHQGRVSCVKLVEVHSWLLSCSSADKCFTCFSTETGQRLSGYLLSAPCTCLLYPFSHTIYLLLKDIYVIHLFAQKQFNKAV